MLLRAPAQHPVDAKAICASEGSTKTAIPVSFHDMETVYIHADESCLGNQKQTQSSPGGAGGLVEIWKDDDWERRDFWLSEPDTTNNRMALSSAIEPLSSLNRRCRIILTSDSQYLVKGINEWRHGWKRSDGSERPAKF